MYKRHQADRQRGRSQQPSTELKTSGNSTSHCAFLLLSPPHISALVCKDHVLQPETILLSGTTCVRAAQQDTQGPARSPEQQLLPHSRMSIFSYPPITVLSL